MSALDVSFLDAFPSTIRGVLVVAGLVAAAALVWASFRIPLRWLFAACLVLALLQGYGPLGFNSVALLCAVALLPGVVVRTWSRSPGVWAITLAALAVWQAVSVLWSYSLGSAAYGVFVSLALLTCFLLARHLLAHDRPGFGRALLVASPFVVLQAAMAIVFRFVPAVERWYLGLPIAQYLTEPGVDVIFSGGHQNVLDPDKSGGFLLNGNIASLLLVLCACVYAVAALMRRGDGMVDVSRRGGAAILWRRGGDAVDVSRQGDGTVDMSRRSGTVALSRRSELWSWSVAGLSLVAALATGSKTPLVLGLAIPFAVLIFVLAVRRGRLAVIVGVVGAVVVAAGVALVSVVKPDLLDEGARTLSERLTFWGLAADQVPEHWLLGMGFGNWREFMVDRVLGNPEMIGDPTLRVVPPHNLFVQAWVDAGLVSLVLTAILAILPIVWTVRSIWRARHAPLRDRETLIPVLALAGLLWILLHGITDTTLFSGDNHTIPWYAVLVAVAASATRLHPASGGDPAHGGRSAPHPPPSGGSPPSV